MGLICPKLSASAAMHVTSVGVNIALKAVWHFGVKCNKLGAIVTVFQWL